MTNPSASIPGPTQAHQNAGGGLRRAEQEWERTIDSDRMMYTRWRQSVVHVLLGPGLQRVWRPSFTLNSWQLCFPQNHSWSLGTAEELEEEAGLSPERGNAGPGPEDGSSEEKEVPSLDFILATHTLA
ncbi:hypothetical protein Cadr_000018364 [Camelus dromedarius]|uniref:Uncharacterized protein n=1 Tax=Camelus dromedarius TaxID=9838 RepID=A0A5N4D758_CAMDR|nr:hypothetical protein Cadr_000018364 [Camelus dromedarius]